MLAAAAGLVDIVETAETEKLPVVLTFLQTLTVEPPTEATVVLGMLTPAAA
jgi:hypothetical protein